VLNRPITEAPQKLASNCGLSNQPPVLAALGPSPRRLAEFAFQDREVMQP